MRAPGSGGLVGFPVVQGPALLPRGLRGGEGPHSGQLIPQHRDEVVLAWTHGWLGLSPGGQFWELGRPSLGEGIEACKVQHRVGGHLGAVDLLVCLVAEGLHLAYAEAILQVTVEDLDLPAVQVGLDEPVGRGNQIRGQQEARSVVATLLAAWNLVGNGQDDDEAHEPALGAVLPIDPGNLLVADFAECPAVVEVARSGRHGRVLPVGVRRGQSRAIDALAVLAGQWGVEAGVLADAADQVRPAWEVANHGSIGEAAIHHQKKLTTLVPGLVERGPHVLDQVHRPGRQGGLALLRLHVGYLGLGEGLGVLHLRRGRHGLEGRTHRQGPMVLIVGDDERRVDHADAPPDLHFQELRSQRVMAPTGLGDSGAGLGQGGIVHGDDNRGLRRERLQAMGQHRMEQVSDAPLRAVEGFVVGGPILLLASLEGDGIGQRAAAMGGQERHQGPGHPLEGPGLLEGREPQVQVRFEAVEELHIPPH